MMSDEEAWKGWFEAETLHDEIAFWRKLVTVLRRGSRGDAAFIYVCRHQSETAASDKKETSCGGRPWLLVIETYNASSYL
jgi:hypothetical protein